MEAVVDPNLCASCGICAGACPSSTPFRSIKDLVTGIDMPQLPIGGMRTELEAALQRLEGKSKIIVFGCDCAAPVAELAAPDVAVFSHICIGQLPPSFVEYALRNGADGVVVTGCHDGDCEYRLGSQWAEQRLAAQREPHLRRNNIALERLRLVSASNRESDALKEEIARFRRELDQLATPAEQSVDGTSSEAAHD
jgi:coenzyme F420-reducing hydrogenase delta subunit